MIPHIKRRGVKSAVITLVAGASMVAGSVPVMAQQRTALPPNGGLRLYDTNRSPTNPEGFTEVWAAFTENHCPASRGVTHLWFEGKWSPGGSFVRRVRVDNKAEQAIYLRSIKHHDAGGDFGLPDLVVDPHRQGTLEINRHIHGGYSVFYFTALRGVTPCGAAGANSWKFSSIG